MVAKNLTYAAASAICTDLGFDHAVEWIHFWDPQRYYNFENNAKLLRVSLSNITCSQNDSQSHSFADCSYDLELMKYLNQILLFLACNPGRKIVSVFTV